ncbi:uncharacterized protein LOC129892673 [Solanum dulcamara]|uniref:uncharacterized protein LOC129892673 n=1 Tax=Solanum dulcamara TaxID=45834 RepID=UPI002486A462|nr:uncharacterized protein LOC129892673 [Solanum dulcamara]
MVGKAKGAEGASRLRVGSWNIGTLSGKSIELVKILKKKKINIACVQEIKWVESKAKEVDGSNIGFQCLRPQVGLDEETKRHFWEDLDEAVVSIPPTEKLFIGGDFNGHIGSVSTGYDEVHGGFGFGCRNGGGASLLDFAKAFGLMLANSSFPKKDEHLVTFRSSRAATQIDFWLLRKDDKSLCKDCKVIPSENLTTQYKLLVIDLEIRRKKKKRVVDDRPRIRWGRLSPSSALEMGEKWMAMGAWDSKGDAISIWDRTASCIRETTRKVLGVSRGLHGGH